MSREVDRLRSELEDAFQNRAHLYRLLLAELEAELGQHARELDAPVEVGAGDVHAMVGEDVVLARWPRRAPRADAHDGEVRRAAADVGHEHDLFARHAALVVERGGDRLVLERDLFEADLARRAFERGLRLRVARGIGVDEEHRPTEYRAADRRALGPSPGADRGAPRVPARRLPDATLQARFMTPAGAACRTAT